MNVFNVRPASEALRLGQLQGNHFDIVVRDVRSQPGDSAPVAERVLEAIETVKVKTGCTCCCAPGRPQARPRPAPGPPDTSVKRSLGTCCCAPGQPASPRPAPGPLDTSVKRSLGPLA